MPLAPPALADPPQHVSPHVGVRHPPHLLGGLIDQGLHPRTVFHPWDVVLVLIHRAIITAGSDRDGAEPRYGGDAAVGMTGRSLQKVV